MVLVDDPADLHLKTTIDGEVRQDESVSDLLFNCAEIISYLSQRTTLEAGSIILTGTPGGKKRSPRKLGTFRLLTSLFRN